MRKAMLMLTVAFLAVGVMFTPVAADWQPGDGHKMHDPQMPDEAGWDVNATQPLVLADDWTCSDSGLIRDVHFWGSWKHGNEGVIDHFVIGFAEDIPADDPLNPTGHSMPGVTIWEDEIWEFTAVPIDPPSMEGWYDPYTGDIFPDDHDAYFQYNIFLDQLYPESELIWQDSGTVYWLFISAIVQPDAMFSQWGWKSSLNHHLDDAVWAEWYDLQWKELYEPAEPKVGSFGGTLNPDGTFTGWGEPAFNNEWYFYEMENWWNVWFYDDPFDSTRIKIVRIEINVDTADVSMQEAFFELALNWSTDLWSIEQPAGDSAPPLPPLSPDDELRYIGRKTLFAGTEFGGSYVFVDTIWDYNPEWVSIDVRGYNFTVDGMIFHSCVVSMDMSFVITGEDEELIGACCYSPSGGPDLEACIETTVDNCNTLGGTYYGDGSQCGGMEACCLKNGTCIDADALCCLNELGGTPQDPGTACTALEACCFTDGSCQMVDPVCCDELGGIPQGPGSTCLGMQACCLSTGECQQMDAQCCIALGGEPQGAGTNCTVPEACCIDDGAGTITCINVDPLCCVELGGIPQGLGTHCSAALEACCLPGSQCVMVDPICCDDMGGVPQGPGTQCTQPEACCLSTGACIEVDPLCCDEMGGVPQGPGNHCTGPIGCCLDNGTNCVNVDPLCCDELGGYLSLTGGPCLGDNNQNGYDDACEEEQSEACCLTDGSCQNLLPADCHTLGGTPQGPGTQCTTLEACCLSITVAGECRDLDPLCCVQLGGTPQGVGTHCTQPEACCFNGGTTCQDIDPLCCDDMGGTVGLTGGQCLGDNNGDGYDDACVPVEELKWQQPPDISETGMDVYASFPMVVLADDFECTAYGPITRIRIWASWLGDQYPEGDPGHVVFYLSLHEDIPAGLSPTGYSMPGEMLWQRPFEPGDFHYDLFEMHPEGFYNPLEGWYEPMGDTECWEYVFYLHEGEFTQQGSPFTPVVYWLNVQAEVMAPVEMFWFGWKTSDMHWNDDAVWFHGVDPVPPEQDWNELRYPPGHPYEPESIDLAFEIYFQATDCCIPPMRGDIDLSGGIIDIADLVYLVDYMFNAGPPPPCYEEADVDATSGLIDIADLVYLVDYMFNSGPLPLPCP
ncbi:MAG: hypothetical protein KAV00_15365 [Phycisphaerae bacterium]|nr:hypothetical protein [Phycisphaerae bacterium]